MADMKKLARYLDAAALNPSLTDKEAKSMIQIAIDFECKMVCVRPCDIEMAKALCEGTHTNVSCVLSFPHGTTSTAVKVCEALDSCSKGVAEIDMVANLSWIRSGRYADVEDEVAAVVRATTEHGVLLKVILETGLLTREEIMLATQACARAGAAFVKTSTGFTGGGATEDAVATMVSAAQGRLQVKASGGIRDAARAWAFLRLGCARLGVNAAAVPALCGDTAAAGVEGTY